MKKVWFLGLLAAAFLAGYSDNDDNENVSIQVAATEFYVVGEKQLIQVPFTVTPADFALTADDIEMGGNGIDYFQRPIEFCIEGDTARQCSWRMGS